jgi:hypothetical protein
MTDMFGTPLSLGDYVVSFNHFYKLEKVEILENGGQYPRFRIQSNAKTRHLKGLCRSVILKMSPEQVEAFLKTNPLDTGDEWERNFYAYD